MSGTALTGSTTVYDNSSRRNYKSDDLLLKKEIALVSLKLHVWSMAEAIYELFI